MVADGGAVPMSSDSSTAPRPRVEFAPAPSAFDMTPVKTGGADARDKSSGGLRHWLTQSMFDISGQTPVHTSRSVVQVTGSDGLQAAANVSVTFDPGYEKVLFHAVRVHRGGEVREAGRPEAFEVIQRELNMERAVYDGRMTAHMVIPDIREGDVVETAYSIIGEHPALKGFFNWWFILQWSAAVAETRCTIRAAASRDLKIRPMGRAVTPTDTTADGVRTLDWRAIDLPPYRGERGSPASFTGFSAVQVADAASWARIADVFRPYYEPGELPAGLAADVAAIAAAHPTPEARVAEGLRFVQGTLRYHSVSIGEGGFRPRPVSQIWDVRFGDCKDASLLLTGVLRQLGVQADCALVNTFRGDGLTTELPSVHAFNHCIVRARVGDRSYWLDPTHPRQAGDLAHLTQAHFYQALPLVADARLEVMPEPALQTISETTETWTFPARADQSAELELTSVFRGWRADGARHWAANQGQEAMIRHLKESLERDLASSISSAGRFELKDDEVNNVLTLVERYYVDEPFRKVDGARRFLSRDDVVGPQLPDVGPEPRREPLMMGAPRRVSNRRVFRFGGPMTLPAWRQTFTGPRGMTLSTELAWTGKREAVHELILTVPQSELAAPDVPAYREFLEQARNNNGISFSPGGKGGKGAKGVKGGKGTDRGGGGIWAVLWWLFVAVMIGRLVMLFAVGG